MARKLRDAAKERRWREALNGCARSGLGVRAFCRREGLAESAFYFWRRELARRDGEKFSRDTSRRSPGAGRGVRRLGFGRPDFLPVRVTDAAASQASITLELASGRVLRLPGSMPIKHVAELVAAIETAGVDAIDATSALADRGAAEVGR